MNAGIGQASRRATGAERGVFSPNSRGARGKALPFPRPPNARARPVASQSSAAIPQTVSAVKRRWSPGPSSEPLRARPRKKMLGSPSASASTWRAETIAEIMAARHFSLELAPWLLALVANGPQRALKSESIVTVVSTPPSDSKFEPGLQKPWEHNVAECGDLLLRRPEGQRRHQIEVPHAELRHLRDPPRAIPRRPDQSERVAQLRDDLVGDERRGVDRRLPVPRVRQIRIDRVDRLRNLELRQPDARGLQPVPAPPQHAPVNRRRPRESARPGRAPPPGGPPKPPDPPPSSARTVRRHSRISASVAARRPMVLAEV